SQGVSVVDMAYLYIGGDMFDTTQYAYVVGGSARYEGHYTAVTVKTADGEKELTKDNKQVTAYNEDTGLITIDGVNYYVDTTKTDIINVNGNKLQEKVYVDCFGSAGEILDLLVIY
ncbi:MAG: hypothetical protein SOR61_04500, partial [Evtepia sp.]|uniref:hypothetical protein n=1 Tax=Evtepia sp. TaxID=2773933 RepID=UPI002A7580CE